MSIMERKCGIRFILLEMLRKLVDMQPLMDALLVWFGRHDNAFWYLFRS
jgi:hypothetical protein